MKTKTYQPKKSEVKRNWHLVDAKGQVLGRMSTDIVKLLMGKHKEDYSRHMDMGDYVVLINSSKVEFTGKKLKDKTYYRHSGYPGGFKEIKLSKLMKESPSKVIELSVRRMLPDNRLRDKRMRRLKIFAGKKHAYESKLI